MAAAAGTAGTGRGARGIPRPPVGAGLPGGPGAPASFRLLPESETRGPATGGSAPPPAPAPRGPAPAGLAPLARRLGRLLAARGLDYDQARALFKGARQAAGLQAPFRDPGLPEILTPGEVAALVAAAGAASARDGLLARLLYETGLRVAECAALRVSDLRLPARTVRVRRGKGGRSRVALLSADLARRLAAFVGDRARGPLFPSRQQGRGLSARRIGQVVTAAAARAGLRASPHTLRRSVGSHLLERGVALDQVADVLGHVDPRTTRQFYARASLATVRRAWDAAMGAGA